MKQKHTEIQHEFHCRICNQVSIAPPNGTPENQRWRQAWAEAGRVACRECLGLFFHESVFVIEMYSVEEEL